MYRSFTLANVEFVWTKTISNRPIMTATFIAVTRSTCNHHVKFLLVLFCSFWRKFCSQFWYWILKTKTKYLFVFLKNFIQYFQCPFKYKKYKYYLKKWNTIFRTTCKGNSFAPTSSGMLHKENSSLSLQTAPLVSISFAIRMSCPHVTWVEVF